MFVSSGVKAVGLVLTWTGVLCSGRQVVTNTFTLRLVVVFKVKLTRLPCR